MARPFADFEPLERDFSPGYLDSPETDTLPLGALVYGSKNSEFQHVRTDPPRRATLRRRDGVTLFTSSGLGGRVDGLFEWRRPGLSPQLLVVAAGKLFRLDGVNTVTTLIGSATFGIGGAAARLTPWRQSAFIYDGAVAKRWDGSTAYDIGFAAPTGISNMTSGGSGALTGTYRAFYLWYNETTDHEGERSEWTPANLTVSAGQRVHTRPSSAAPAGATHWRVYVQRVDTFEILAYRVGTVPVADASFTEEVIDNVRTLPGPSVNENLPPPVTFAILEEFHGYGIGVALNATDYYTSKLNDLESWNPLHVFPVSRGDGEAITSAKKYGTNLLLQTPHKTYRLVGTRVPFVKEAIHSNYGNVSQDAGIEVEGVFYAWDRVRGPYATDLVRWRPIGDARIGRILSLINNDALDDIRVAHFEKQNMIGWAVPLQGTRRKRVMLLYNYLLDAWLPPWDGLEYTSLSQWTRTGVLEVYAGDEWGRIFRLGGQDVDGVPALHPLLTISSLTRSGSTASATTSTAHGYSTGDVVTVLGADQPEYNGTKTITVTGGSTFDYTVSGTPASPATGLVVECRLKVAPTVSSAVASGTTSTVTIASGNLFTGGDGLAGLMCALLRADGTLEWRRIASNTLKVITLDTTNGPPWTTAPTSNDTLFVGPIDFMLTFPVIDYGQPFREKRLGYFLVQGRTENPDHQVHVKFYFDEDISLKYEADIEIPVSAQSLWGVGLWATALWGGKDTKQLRKVDLPRSCYTVQAQISNFRPNQPVEITAYGITSDAQPRKLAPGTG